MAITDDRFGPQRPSLFEVLLHPRGLVITTQCGVDSPSQHSGAEGTRSRASEPPMKHQSDLIRSAHVEVIPDHAFKPHPARLGPVKHTGVGDLKLAKGQFVNVPARRSAWVNGEGKRRTQRQKKLFTAAGPSRSQIFCNAAGSAQEREPVIQSLVADPGSLQLPLGPFVAVEPEPDGKGGIDVGLPKHSAPIRIPKIEVEVIDVDHLAPPLHVRMPGFLLSWTRPRSPGGSFLLGDPDQHHAIWAFPGRCFQVGTSHFHLVLPFLELPEWVW